MEHFIKRNTCIVLILAVLLTLFTGCGNKGVLPEEITSIMPEGYKGVNITEHTGAYSWQNPVRNTYTFDFSLDRKSYYTKHEVLSITGEGEFDIKGGKLEADNGTFNISTKRGLGDDYGLEAGYVKISKNITGGKLHLGVRTSELNVTNKERGIWFTFDGSDKIAINEPESGLEAQITIEDNSKIQINENVDSIQLIVGEKTVATIKYDVKGTLEVLDENNQIVASTDKSEIYTAGYFQIYTEDFTGTLDDFEFTTVDIDQTLYTDGERREIDYSTWIATDELGRTVATNKEAGDVRDEKYVGVFYFLCWVGAGQVVRDNTKLYLKYGLEGLLEYFDEGKGGEHYWGEPYFGYYRNTDTWVYRKHAFMLEAAGVDFIYLDVSNAKVFIEGHMALFDTWLQIRNEGGMTPQIVFLTGDNSQTFEKDMSELFTTVYSDENWNKYSELFFEVDGKPLVFGNISGVSPEMAQKINDKFTVRGNWAWTDKDGYWNWIQEYTYDEKTKEYGMVNGGWGRSPDGTHEALAISLGHHPSASKGRSFTYGTQPYNGKNDMEFSSIERAGKGINFETQFKAAMSFDPTYLLITGWNEWIAGCTYSASGEYEYTVGGLNTSFCYVDQFNAEFSRDGEPMRNRDGYGFGDNYYYQMADYIRKFKGIDATPTADNQQKIDIYDVNEWNNIDMKYMDNIGDTELRNSISYDASYRYINNTGRNDFDYAKVSQSSDYMYFMVKCVNDIVIDNGKNWMNLYLNTDGDKEKGWNGFDYVINRDRDSYVVTVEEFDDGSYKGDVVGAAEYYIQGQYMVIRVNKQTIGLSGTVKELFFKWADNSTDDGDIMAFMDLGDTAPNDRYAFWYKTDKVSDKSFDKSKTPANDDPVIERPLPDIGNNDDNNETIIRQVEMLYDLEDESAGDFAEESAISDIFEIAKGTSESSVRFAEENGNKFIQHTGFLDLRTLYDIESEYVFSADVRIKDYTVPAFFIRGEMPGLFTPHNPTHSNMAGQEIDAVFNYYEVDWYKENGGRQGATSVAGSGLGIYLRPKKLMLKVKKYVPDGLTVTSSDFSISYPEGFSLEKEFVNIKVEDNKEEIKIYLNNILAATIKLENPEVTYETDGTGNTYYGKVTIFDSTGNEVGVVENSRLNSRGSQIAFTTRNQNVEYDNIYISYEEETVLNNHKMEFVNKEALPEGEPDISIAAEYYGLEKRVALAKQIAIICASVLLVGIVVCGILVARKRKRTKG